MSLTRLNISFAQHLRYNLNILHTRLTICARQLRIKQTCLLNFKRIGWKMANTILLLIPAHFSGIFPRETNFVSMHTLNGQNWMKKCCKKACRLCRLFCAIYPSSRCGTKIFARIVEAHPARKTHKGYVGSDSGGGRVPHSFAHERAAALKE